MKENRRKFLKKALYTAPVLVVLGEFVTPPSLHANIWSRFGIWPLKEGSNKRVRPERETKRGKN